MYLVLLNQQRWPLLQLLMYGKHRKMVLPEHTVFSQTVVVVYFGCGVVAMNEFTISSAQYLENNCSIIATINGVEMVVPIDPDNRHYDEIQRQVAAGDLTIQDAD